MGTLCTVPFRESFATNPCRFLASFTKFFAAILLLSYSNSPFAALAVPVGAPTDGANHGTMAQPIVLSEDVNTEGSPTRTLRFKLTPGTVTVAESGGGKSDSIDFMRNPDNANFTDFAITSDRRGANDTDTSSETEGPFTISNPNDNRNFVYVIRSPSETPLPPAVWLMGSAIIVFAGSIRRKS